MAGATRRPWELVVGPGTARSLFCGVFEGINPATLGAVRALARELRYASLPSVVGRRVRIESVAGIDQILRAAVPALGTSARLANDEEQMGLTLSKYGILDLSYVVASITARPLGYAGLLELGLLDREVTEDMIGWDGELVRWVDECRRDQPLLRIFLALHRVWWAAERG